MPSVSELATGGFAPERRLDRARWLLERFEATQGGRGQPDTREIWDWLDADWRWVARSSKVRRLLARGDGVNKNEDDAVVANIQGAVANEFLPMLRIKWLLVGVRDKWDRAALDPFIEYLQTCSLAGAVTPGFSWWYALFLRVLGHLDVEPSTTVLDNIARLLRTLGEERIQAWDLTLAFVEVVGRTTFPRIREDTKASWLKTKLQKAEAVEAAGPPCLPLLGQISMLHLVCGARDSKGASHMAESCRHMVRALYLDPYSSAARDNINNLQEMSRKLQEQVASMRPGQQLTGEGNLLVNGLKQGLSFIHGFKDTDEAKGIVKRREQAIRLELARRLDLDPTQSTHLEVAGTLPKAILEAKDALPAEKALPKAIRGHVVRQSPELASLPWDRIEKVLDQNPPLDEEVLTLLLPPPLPVPLETQIEQAGLAATPAAGESSASPPIPRSLWSAMWLFSSRDLAWKMVGIAGFALLLWGGAAELVSQVRERAKDSIYSRLVDKVRKSDDTAVLALTPDFLRRLSSPASDPRTSQVGEWFEEAAYRELFRLVNAGKTAEASALLARYHATPFVTQTGRSNKE